MSSSPAGGPCISLPEALNRGFTMVELVVVTMLIAILAAVALPKLDSALGMRNDGFKEGLVAGLRYAARTAVAQRRLVCATVSNTQLVLRIASSNVTGNAMSCDTDLSGPGSGNVFVQSANLNSQVSMTQALNGVSGSYSGAIYFQPDGRATASAAGSSLGVLQVSAVGASGTVTVVGETAHVE